MIKSYKCKIHGEFDHECKIGDEELKQCPILIEELLETDICNQPITRVFKPTNYTWKTIGFAGRGHS